VADSEKKKCFVIAPIGPKDSDIRKRSDNQAPSAKAQARRKRRHKLARKRRFPTPNPNAKT